MWQTPIYLPHTLNMWYNHILIAISNGNILAQPVFNRLRSILSCFVYIQIQFFYLLLYIISQSKCNKHRTIKFQAPFQESFNACHFKRCLQYVILEIYNINPTTWGNLIDIFFRETVLKMCLLFHYSLTKVKQIQINY